MFPFCSRNDAADVFFMQMQLQYCLMVTPIREAIVKISNYSAADLRNICSTHVRLPIYLIPYRLKAAEISKKKPAQYIRRLFDISHY